MVSHEFRCISILPLVSREFRPLVASSGLFWGRYLGCRPQPRAQWDGGWFRRTRCGFSRITFYFDAPAVVSHEFRCISMLRLWFRANSGLASSGGPLRLPTAMVRAVRPPGGRINKHTGIRGGLGFRVNPAAGCRGLVVWGSDFGVEHHEYQLGLLAPKFHTRAKPNPPVVGVLLTPREIRPPTNFCTFCLRECRCSSGLLWPFLVLLTVWELRRRNSMSYFAMNMIIYSGLWFLLICFLLWLYWFGFCWVWWGMGDFGMGGARAEGLRGCNWGIAGCVLICPLCAAVVARCEVVNLGFEPIVFESLDGLEQGTRDLLANLRDRIDERCRHGAGSFFSRTLGSFEFRFIEETL